ncbi:hypothetical protein AGMMS49928_00890 [Spirochaetia bacterium]|nr:hypothetical protein AGMMS49928_00890 [Spirochaetia bacterium]
MKRCIFALAAAFVLAIPAGFAAAEENGGGDEEIGLSAGVELGFGDVADEAKLGITPNVVYENSFDALDIFAELDYTIGIDDPVMQELYLEVELGYNFEFSGSGVLSVIANSQNTFYIDPAPEDGFTHLGIVEPGIKYTHTLDIGDLYGQLGFPISYWTGIKDESAVDSYVTLGWASNFGLGLELTGNFALNPETDFAGCGFLVSYEQGIFYGEVECAVDKEFKSLEIKPQVDISPGPWTFTVRAEFYKFDGIDDWAVMPFIGAGYSF